MQRHIYEDTHLGVLGWFHWVHIFAKNKEQIKKSTQTQQQTTNTFEKPQPPAEHSQKMWALKSHFRWARSIHHNFSFRKGGRVALADWREHWWGEQPGYQTGTIKTGTGSKRSHSSASGSFSFPPFSPSSSPPTRVFLRTWLHPIPPFERGWG